MNISETDKAYLAGLFDGEGCVGYYNANPDSDGTPYCHTQVCITNTNEDVISWVNKVANMGRVSMRMFNDGKRRNAFSWQISKKAQVREFLEAIRPYLHVKAAQVDAILNLFHTEKDYIQRHGSVSPEVAALRMGTVAQLRALKRTA